MGSGKTEMYDISPKAKEILDYNYQRRVKLRQEYLKECLKPTKQYLLLDSAVERFFNMRNLHEYRLKVDAKGTGVAFAVVFGSIAALALFIEKGKGDMEHKYRTGQVSYADREFKIL